MCLEAVVASCRCLLREVVPSQRASLRRHVFGDEIMDLQIGFGPDSGGRGPRRWAYALKTLMWQCLSPVWRKGVETRKSMRLVSLPPITKRNLGRTKMDCGSKTKHRSHIGSGPHKTDLALKLRSGSERMMLTKGFGSEMEAWLWKVGLGLNT